MFKYFQKKKNIQSSIIFCLKILIFGYVQEKMEACWLLWEGKSICLVFFLKFLVGQRSKHCLVTQGGCPTHFRALGPPFWTGAGCRSVWVREWKTNRFLQITWLWARSAPIMKLVKNSGPPLVEPVILSLKKKIQEKRHKAKVKDWDLIFFFTSHPSILYFRARQGTETTCPSWEKCKTIGIPLTDWLTTDPKLCSGCRQTAHWIFYWSPQ